VTDQARVIELTEQLLAEYPPATTDPVTFLGAQFDLGLAWIHFDEGFGGLGLARSLQRPVLERLQAAGAPSAGQRNPIGAGMAAPTIATWGTDEQKKRYLRPLFTGEEVWCQLFSEPGAGSDVAALATSAVPDGDDWVINGQKVWTTLAHLASFGILVARTDPNLPKHKGLTGFIVNMRDPAVEIRPLRQMTGGASFNEVFFNELRVPDDHRLGDVNNGWNVALTTLMNERAAIGAGGGGGGGGLYGRVIEMTRAFGLTDDPITRQMLVDLIIHQRVSNYNNQRAMDKIKAGGLPGPEMSMAKLAGTMNMRRMSDYVSHVLGVKLVADSGEWGTYSWGQLVLGGPGGRIAGGTDEVMRNIVGERVLGLPKDPGIDSNSPFKDLKVGTQAS